MRGGHGVEEGSAAMQKRMRAPSVRRVVIYHIITSLFGSDWLARVDETWMMDPRWPWGMRGASASDRRKAAVRLTFGERG